MTHIPLRLDRYFFPRISVEARRECSLPAPDSSDDGLNALEVDVNIDLFKHDTEPYRYQVRLAVEGLTVPDSEPPYDLQLEVVGFFTVDAEAGEQPNIERLVQNNGASLLYSAAREYVLTVTGRGPWGAIMLPTLNF
jgi:preprotein translocase subunit SecB